MRSFSKWLSSLLLQNLFKLNIYSEFSQRYNLIKNRYKIKLDFIKILKGIKKLILQKIFSSQFIYLEEK